MRVLTQSYDLLELQQLRSELEQRNIAVHIADEFTYAIPGMPGAERPRRVLVAQEDLVPARLVVADLLGEDRIHREKPKEAGLPAVSKISIKTIVIAFVVVGFFMAAVTVLSR